MGANSSHSDAVDCLRDGLLDHFREVPNVVVDRELPMFYDEQDSTKRVEPDILVVLDHEVRIRSSYMFRVERKVPDVALEVVSPRSGIRNGENKKELYADLGIKEFFLFQPNVEGEEPRLVGYRLREEKGVKEYVELQHDPAAGPAGALRSEVLGVSLRPEGALVRLRNIATGEDYAWSSEKFDENIALKERVAAAERKAGREAKARRASDENARREAKARRASDENARRAVSARHAADENARRAVSARHAAEENARRAVSARHAAEENARRAVSARHAAEEQTAAALERARSAEARIAEIEAVMALAGIQLPEDR